jgi:uncharacterized integral membrane protein
MQLMLILGIVFAIGAVIFALQNTAIVAVSLAVWQFEGSLAVVLLVALGLGVLITGLLSSPAVIRRQWTTARLRRQVSELEHEVAAQKERLHAYATEIARLMPEAGMQTPEEEKHYVGLRALLAGGDKAPTIGN